MPGDDSKSHSNGGDSMPNPPRAELHQFAAALLKIDLALIEENETHGDLAAGSAAIHHPHS